MILRKHMGKFRSLVPQPVRERMYEWHPGRARRWQRFPGVERCEGSFQAVLTFDDGPDPDGTPAVLDALELAGIRATFFLLGTQLADHEELAQELVRRGHEVGLHGYEHRRHDRIEADVSRADLERGFAAIEETLGVRCRWYRPPYGKMSPSSESACQHLGLTPVYWSAWGLDWENVTAERIAGVVCDQLDDGGIILLHDSARFGRRPSARPTAEALPAIVGRAQERGISFVTLGDALPSHREIPA